MALVEALVVIEYAKTNEYCWKLAKRDVDPKVYEVVGLEIFGQPLHTTRPEYFFVQLIRLLAKHKLDGGSINTEDALDGSRRRITVVVAPRNDKLRGPKGNDTISLP